MVIVKKKKNPTLKKTKAISCPITCPNKFPPNILVLSLHHKLTRGIGSSENNINLNFSVQWCKTAWNVHKLIASWITGSGTPTSPAMPPMVPSNVQIQITPSKSKKEKKEKDKKNKKKGSKLLKGDIGAPSGFTWVNKWTRFNQDKWLPLRCLCFVVLWL